MSQTIKTKGSLSIVEFKDHNSVVNAIRRTILDDVPTFAIEDVEIVKNDSPLYDETLAHRLGLVPIVTDLKSYNSRETCKCGGVGCALCEVKMGLKQEEVGFVESSSIKSEDPKVVPAITDLPITKLFGDQKLEVNLKAVLGTGRAHAKWAPAHSYLVEDKNKLNLIIEPFGQLSGKDIYNTAIDILCAKIDELGEQL